VLTEEMKIPQERVGALIGAKGSTRQMIENSTNSKLEIDSNEGIVIITADESETEGFLNAQQIVKAIGRGFSPEKAIMLRKEDYVLDLLDLSEDLGKSQKAQMQKKGRIIGKKGSIRELIEQETDSYLSVYGKTVAIIGKMESIDRARAAVEMLIQGANHTTVKKFLKRREQVEKFSL